MSDAQLRLEASTLGVGAPAGPRRSPGGVAIPHGARIRQSEANGGAIHGPRVRQATGECGAERRGAHELTAAGRGAR
eukprot:10851465-Alexandrium_andersonii.AAC.1